jgi:hypothetical protein
MTSSKHLYASSQILWRKKEKKNSSCWIAEWFWMTWHDCHRGGTARTSSGIRTSLSFGQDFGFSLPSSDRNLSISWPSYKWRTWPFAAQEPATRTD